MTTGNKGFSALLTEGLDESAGAGQSSPAAGIISSRNRALSQIASGKIVADKTQFVDPARCRPWRLHNRDLDHLNEDSCSDLINSFLSAKKQRIPAVVRRLRGDPDYDYEIVAGVRRWWTVTWLRNNHHEDFEYLVTVQNLSDEEAFRLSDLENRARKDITDWERAVEYENALSEFYNNSQKEMAEHLKISKSWLTRLLDVARLPPEIVAAFHDKHDITVRIARDLKPLGKDQAAFTAMVVEAQLLESERSNSSYEMSGPEICKRLVAATRKQKAGKRSTASKKVLSHSNRLMLTTTQTPQGWNIRIHEGSGATKKEILAAIGKLL